MMPTVKRQIARFIEYVSGNLVIPPNELHFVHEQLHLRRFFSHFGVDCVFDVGANSGQYATMIRHRVGFKGPIISYEPIPELVNAIRVLSAQDANWQVESLAMDQEAGPAVFHVMASNTFSSLHLPAADQPETFQRSNRVVRDINVERCTIANEFVKWQNKLGFKRPFLKIDTQGNDHAVIKGAGDMLQAFVGLQAELPIQKLYTGSEHMARIIDDCTQRGFELSALVPNNAGHFPALVEIDCIMFNRSAQAH